MKLAYSFTADIHAIDADGELTYMITQDVPFAGEMLFLDNINKDELARLGVDGALEWLDECQRDGVDEAFWDLFGKAIRQRHANLGDMFGVEWTVDKD